MAENSKIAWTYSTFNPWIGCSKVHEGCTHCYAESLAKRTGKAVWGVNGTRSKTSDKNWREPIKWDAEATFAQERRRVFCASLADVFEDWDGEVLNYDGTAHYTSDDGRLDMQPSATFKNADSDGYHYTTLNDVRAKLFRLIDQTPSLDWLLLTKRPENIRRMWPRTPGLSPQHPGSLQEAEECLYRDNVWLGTSISSDKSSGGVEHLRKARDLSPVLFLSAEPLLGRLGLEHCGAINRVLERCSGCQTLRNGEPACPGHETFVSNVDQVIIGVESRGSHLGSLGEFQDERDWCYAASMLVMQCQAAGIAPFVKQIPVKGKLSHDPADWPEALRVREFPEREAVA